MNHHPISWVQSSETRDNDSDADKIVGYVLKKLKLLALLTSFG